MIKEIGYTDTDSGTVHFQMDRGTFIIKTPYKTFQVYEDELIHEDGKTIFHMPKAQIRALNVSSDIGIEIPAAVLEAKEKAILEYELTKASIGFTKTKQGTVYFSITDDGKILCKTEDKAIKTERVYSIEGKRVAYVPELGLESDFIEVPEKVEIKLKEYKKRQEFQSLHMVYAGRSVLTDVDYYDFNCDIDSNTWARVKMVFEYFGEGGDAGLQGWLTSQPEKVEEWLPIRKNKVSERVEEIEKAKAQYVKKQAAAVKKLTA